MAAMAKYEVILKQYPPDDGLPSGYWTAICPAVAGCVTDGETREEALGMVADAIDLCLEDALPLDDAKTQRERDATLREADEADVIAIEFHWVEPRAMTDEELASWPTSTHLVSTLTT
jgi:predicted RNase H-like HicB family nuclease